MEAFYRNFRCTACFLPYTPVSSLRQAVLDRRPDR